MSSRGARVARGLAAAGFATYIAALFHVAGGGLPPSMLALTLSLTFSGLACIALAGRRSSWWRLVLSVGISQFLFHALFSLSPSGGFAGAGEHMHPGTQIVLVPGPASTMPMGLEGQAMWSSHIVAALVTIAAVRYGERSFRAVCEFTAFQLRLLFSGAALGPVRVGVHSPRIETVPTTLPIPALLLGRLRHRGPPMMVSPA